MTQNEIQNLLNNSYTPAFFKMKVDVFEDLSNLNELRTPIKSLYFHEYVHFIQDISTIYGLMGISNTTYYVRDAAASICRKNSSAFSIPHKLSKNEFDYGFNNHLTWEYYRGSSINPMRKNINIISNPKKKIKRIDGNKLCYIQFLAKDVNTGEEFEFRFGGNILTEGMAYLCERFVFNKCFENEAIPYNFPNEYPYRVCEKVVEREYPELLECPIIIIALCDLALMNYNPGLMFIELIRHIKQIKILEKQDRPIKDLFDFFSYFYDKGNEFLKFHQCDFSLMQKYVLKEIKEYFKDVHLEKSNEWISKIFERILDYREKFPQFIIDILLSSNQQGLESNQLFKDFVNLVGSPIVLDGDDNCTYIPPMDFDHDDFSPSLFMAIHQMYLLFINSSKKLPCALKNLCQMSNMMVDSNCDSAPWMRASYNNLCPYGAMWKHWGLTGKYPGTK